MLRCAWCLTAFLVFLPARALAIAYLQEREEMLAAGDLYVQEDVQGYLAKLTAFAAKNKGSYWRFDARIIESLIRLTRPSEREQARQLLRQVSMDAKDLAHGPLAWFMIARSYEEEGLRDQALKEYLALANLPVIPDALERSEKVTDSYSGSTYYLQRYPAFLANTAASNALPIEAALRAAAISRMLPGTSNQLLPAAIRTPEPGKAIEFIPPAHKRKTGSTVFILRSPPGQAVKMLTAEAQVLAGKRNSRALLRVEPFYPVLPSARPADFAPDTAQPGVTVAPIQFDTPLSVMKVSIDWDGPEIARWRITPLLVPELPPPPPQNLLNLTPVLSKGLAMPFARGINNIRLSYDETSRMYNLLLALPEEIAGRPDTAPSMYVSQSPDGKTWSQPRLLEISSVRTDKWPDACRGVSKFRIVWVSDRRGTGMDELFFSSGTNIFDCRMSGALVIAPEDYPGFPGEGHALVSTPVIATASGIDYVFFVARVIGVRKRKSDELAVKCSGIFYLELMAGKPPRLKTVLSTGQESLEKYLGKPGPTEDSPEVSGDAPLSVFLDAAGNFVVGWTSDTGKACLSVQAGASGAWRTARINLPGGTRVTEFLLLKAGKSLVAVASVEGTGVVLYAQEKNVWKEKVVILPESVYRCRIAAVERPDGKIIVVAVPRGICALEPRTAVVDPATGAIE